MKKLYTSILAALLLLPASLSAQTMTEENVTLSSKYESEWGGYYSLEKDVDFVGATVNGVPIDPAYSLQYSGVKESVSINKYNPERLTNKGLEFISFQMPGNGISWDTNGLRSTSNERWIGLNDLRVGQIVVFDRSSKDDAQFVVNSIACNSGTGWADTFSDPLILEEISVEIHELQALTTTDPDTGDEISGTADGFRYFKVINNGTCWIKFNGKSPSNYLYRFQIWTPTNAPEKVSAPQLQVIGAYGAGRSVMLTPGVSTKGSEVKVFYTLDGTQPLMMKDSEEVDHYAVLDDDGAEVKTYTIEQYEAGEVLAEDAESLVAVYKQVLDTDAVEDFADPEWIYNCLGEGDVMESDGMEFTVTKADYDEISDGLENDIVVIKAVTVSSTGVISSVVDLSVDVSAIYLNDPTLTLVGFDGLNRQYRFNWTDNTKGDATITITYTADGGEVTGELLNGDVFAFQDEATITIDAGAAYESSVTTWTAANQGDEFSRKSDNAEGGHDWDFRNFSEDILNKIGEKVIDYYVKFDADGNEVGTHYTEAEWAEIQLQLEEYESEEDIPEEYQGVEKVIKYFGWDGLDSRSAGRHWRTWIPTYEDGVDDSGNPTQTIVSSVYADDETGLLHDLVVDNSHPSYSTIAIYIDPSNAQGLQFMNAGTIYFSPDVIQYGEYLVIDSNKGIYIVEANNAYKGFTWNVPGSTYLYSIDIFTYDNLPDAPQELIDQFTGIEDVAAQKTQSNAIYNLAGQRVDSSYKGIVIKNGKKILVK